MAVTQGAAVEPTAALEGEPASAQKTVPSMFETADFSGPGTCTMCHERGITGSRK